MYNPNKHGRAEYGRYAQLNDTQLNSLTAQEGTDTLPLSGQKFASLVYQINPFPIQVSGLILDIGNVGIIDPLTQLPTIVDNKGDLHVYDTRVETSINTLSTYLYTTYSKIITSDINFIYIAEAFPGTLSGSTGWRMKRIDNNGITTWADGNNKFDNIGSNIITAIYTL